MRPELSGRSDEPAPQWLAAVIAAPDDEAARLVYADAVAIDDPARALFVALQIERWRRELVQRLPFGRPSPRERALLRARGSHWARAVAPFARPGPRPSQDPGWAFQRGFVSFLRVDAAVFEAVGPQLFELAPLQHLDLVGERPVPRRLLESPLLGRIESIGLAGMGLGDHGAEVLAESSRLDRCHWLDLRHNGIGPRGLEALAASPRVRAVPIVLLGDNPCDPGTRRRWCDHCRTGQLPPNPALALERRHGPIPWLQLPLPGGQPDRFYARSAASVCTHAQYDACEHRRERARAVQ